MLSHTRTFEEGDDSAELSPAAPKRAGRKSEEGATGGQSLSVKSVNEKVEKSTLGDLSVLSDLKSAMETKERGGSKSKKKQSEEEEEDSAE